MDPVKNAILPNPVIPDDMEIIFPTAEPRLETPKDETPPVEPAEPKPPVPTPEPKDEAKPAAQPAEDEDLTVKALEKLKKSEKPEEPSPVPPKEPEPTPGPKHLRAELEHVRKELSQRAAELKAVQEERDRLVKRVEEMESQIALADYRQSREYKEQIETPLQNAYERLLGIAGKLRNQRTEKPGGEAEVTRLLSIARGASDLAELETAVEEVFGETGSRLLIPALMETVQIEGRAATLNRDLVKKADEWRKQRELTLKQQMDILRETIKRASAGLFDKFNDSLSLTEEERKQFEKAAARIDAMLSGQLSPDEYVERMARLRAEGAMVPTLLARLSQMQDRIAELEEQLSEQKATTPRVRPPTKPMPGEEDLDEDARIIFGT